MFKAVRTIGSSLVNGIVQPFYLGKKNFSCFSSLISYSSRPVVPNATLMNSTTCENSTSGNFLQAKDTNLSFSRNVTKFSLKTGKKKSVNAVLTRFYRLHCGLWIRRRGGCHSRMWKRNTKERYDLRQHIVCTRTQSIVLDKMITDFHKKRKYYIDDPFEPYHDRHNFDWVLPHRQR